jgi:hypothetical protein
VKLVLLAAVCALSAVAIAAPAGAGVSCTAGTRTVSGVTERTFCGSAKATVHVGSQTFGFSQGQCTKAPYFAVNIGTVVLGASSKHLPEYFGVTAQKTGGKVKAIAIVFDHAGKGYPVRPDTAKISLSGTKGTFSGETFTGTKVSGSFSC